MLICMLVAGTWHQSRVWTNYEWLNQAMARTAGVNSPLSHIHAKLLLGAGKIEETRAYIHASAAVDLRFAGPVLDVLINLEISQGNFDHAFAMANMLVRGHIDSYLTWEYLGNIAMHRGEPDKALRYYKRSIAPLPMQGKTNLLIALAYDALHEPELALAQLQEAIQKAPDNLYIQSEAGMMYYKHGQFDKAIVYLQKTTASDVGATDERAWYALGLSLARTDRLSEAIDAYRHVLRLKPQWSEASNSLGVVLARTGQIREAAEIFAQALASDPNNTEAANNLKHALSIRQTPHATTPAAPSDMAVDPPASQ